MAAVSSSQYLQVPKIPLRRKNSSGRNVSKSRPRDERPEAVIDRTLIRPQTPPMPVLESYQKHDLNGCISSRVNTRQISTSSTMNQVIDQPSPRMQELRTTLPGGFPWDELSTDLKGSVYTADQSFTPPPVIPLRQRLIGAWKLESYTSYPTATSVNQRLTYPMTKNVTGFIMYTPDGYMSSQMLIPGQPSFKRSEGDAVQWTEAAKRFFAYSGPYYISNDGFGREETLRHTFEICNLPGWIGDIQIRTHRFEDDGDVLVLGNEEPAEINGDKRLPELKWRRARDNSSGTPPPPLPQIKISSPGEP